MHLPTVAEYSPSRADRPDDIDTRDGAKIARHVFGPNEDKVAHQLGGIAGGAGLVRALIPTLAPLVMSWLAGRMQQGGAGNTQAQAPGKGGLLETILGQVLGGLLGGGRR